MSGTLSRPGKGHPGTEETDGLAPDIQNKDRILYFGSRTGIKVRLFYRSAFYTPQKAEEPSGAFSGGFTILLFWVFFPRFFRVLCPFLSGAGLCGTPVCLRAASLSRALNGEAGSVPRFPLDKLRLCFDGAPEVSKIYGAEAFVTLLRTGHGF